MKRFLFFTIIFVCYSNFNAIAQTDSVKIETSTADSAPMQTAPINIDSLTIEYLSAIYEKVSTVTPRYKIYQTENIYNLLKLDTATGQLWLVQYRTNSTDSGTVAINSKSLLFWSWEKPYPGRFELYPTKNMYQFILIDTETGKTWQAQWSTSADKRFIERLY